MRVRIYHCDGGPGHEPVYVANVKFAGDSVEDALDYAWRRSQNIEGSWSRGPWLDGVGVRPEQQNRDYSPDVVRIAPLPVHNGKRYGLRSSMVGDIFEVEGKAFKVASFGFEPCEVPE